jgi:hypothetical protein
MRVRAASAAMVVAPAGALLSLPLPLPAPRVEPRDEPVDRDKLDAGGLSDRVDRLRTVGNPVTRWSPRCSGSDYDTPAPRHRRPTPDRPAVAGRGHGRGHAGAALHVHLPGSDGIRPERHPLVRAVRTSLWQRLLRRAGAGRGDQPVNRYSPAHNIADDHGTFACRFRVHAHRTHGEPRR